MKQHDLNTTSLSRMPANKTTALKRSIKPYLYLLPSFVLIFVFYYYAVVYAFGLSMTDTILGLGGKFIGLGNYIRLFKDPVFKTSIVNLGLFAVFDVMKALTFPMLAAELLYFFRSERFSAVFKRILIFPMLVPGMVIMMMWYNMLDPSLGLVNQVLGKLGLTSWQRNWFFDPNTAIWSIMAIGFPYIAGLNFLIFHTALNGISKEHVEAARLDGCTSMQLIRYIHIPTIIPHMGTVVVLTLTSSLQNYGNVLVTTRGGPGYATYVPALIMYNNMSSEIGYAAAAGVFCFLMIMVTTTVVRRVVAAMDKS